MNLSTHTAAPEGAAATAATKLSPSDTRLRYDVGTKGAVPQEGETPTAGDTAAGDGLQHGTSHVLELIASFTTRFKAAVGWNGYGSASASPYTDTELEEARAAVEKLKAYSGGVPELRRKSYPVAPAPDPAGAPPSPSNRAPTSFEACPGTPEQVRRQKLAGKGFLGFSTPDRWDHRASSGVALSG